jgi:hypothetical protein
VKCVILQPSYMPWRGYFHLIQKADVFVFYDDVQYDHGGWRNRNRIKTSTGLRWLTIPVVTHGALTQRTSIHQIRTLTTTSWNRKHFETLRHSYSRAPFFRHYEHLLLDFYASPRELLADFTIETTIRLARELGINGTVFLRSSELRIQGERTERLIEILKHVGADHYITGPAARNYLEEMQMTREGIQVEWMIYDYPEYMQLYPPYESHVSILDLLFMQGPESWRSIWPKLE